MKQLFFLVWILFAKISYAQSKEIPPEVRSVFEGTWQRNPNGITKGKLIARLAFLV
jgi:hypothetical protein